LTLSIICRKIK